MNKNPLISIVTVVYNGEKYLEKTIQSIINQTYKNIEYIIIDGGSSDGTLDIIKKYEDKISCFVSEKDEGIYDGMNKGIYKCTGDFVLFLNSGDLLSTFSVLEELEKHIKDKEKTYFARARIYHDKNLNWLYPNENITHKNINSWLKNNLPNHQAMLFPKSFYKKENYELKYKICADADFKYKAMKKTGFVYVPIEFCKFYLGGLSSTYSLKKTFQMLNEIWNIQLKYNGFYSCLKACSKYIVKYILSLAKNNYLLYNITKKYKSYEK